MRKVASTISGGVFGGMLLSVSAGLLAPLPGGADPGADELSGPYTISNPQNGKTEAVTFSPCGPGCATTTAWGRPLEFHLADGMWSAHSTQFVDCDGRDGQTTIRFMSGPNAIGSLVHTFPEGCAGEPPGYTDTIPIMVAKG